jgi:hypothetical protein
MLERFLTTGQHTSIGSLPFPHCLNAGVGGYCIKNILFLLGSKDLFPHLRPRNIKLIWLQMVTNDLTPKRGLRSQEIEAYALVLEG